MCSTVTVTVKGEVVVTDTAECDNPDCPKKK